MNSNILPGTALARRQPAVVSSPGKCGVLRAPNPQLQTPRIVRPGPVAGAEYYRSLNNYLYYFGASLL